MLILDVVVMKVYKSFATRSDITYRESL